MELVRVRLTDPWHRNLPDVRVVVLLAGHEGRVREHESSGYGERLGVESAPLPDAEPVDVIHSRGGDVFVQYLIGALSVAGLLQTGARRPVGPPERPVIAGVQAAEVVRDVVADVAFGEPVKLVVADKVHPADLHRIIACRTHRMGVGWSPRVQYMGVAPDLALVGVLSCQEGRPRRHAEGRSAVGVGEDRAPRGEGVQVRSPDGRFAVAAGDVGVVLVRLDVEDVGALPAVGFGGHS